MAERTEDRRVQRSKDAVMKATLELLTEDGLAGLSIDKVSARSGVAKTTVYRHWPSRAELLLDACSSLTGPFTLADTGSFRGDLVALVREIRARFESQLGSMLPSIMDAAEREPEMAALFAASTQKLIDAIQVLIDRAVRRKEIRPGIRAKDLAVTIVGPLAFQRWFSRSRLSDAFIRRVVDQSLRFD
jgi:AcrR family transcriptional regulator